MALCVPISKYRQIKKLRDDAVHKIEEVTKEFDELKETTEEYKQKIEDLQKVDLPTSPKKLGGEDEADGGKLELEEEPYKEEASKREAWPEEMKVKALAKMSMVYLHSGTIRKDPKSRRGTLTVKPLEITIVNLSKKTTLHLGASFFKSGRFATQPTGYIEAGESHTYSISSKDGRAKTGVKGGLAFIVYDMKEEEPEEEEEKHDSENGEKKKKKKKEKKEKKRKEKKSKKDKKKKKDGEEGEGEEQQENKEAEDGENKEENNEGEEKEEGETKAESEAGDAPEENNQEADKASIQGEEVHKEHMDEDEEELPDGNGDFFICAFENPLAGAMKAKCNKTESKDITPLVKQLKNNKEINQEYFGQFTQTKRHVVFIWKDEEVEW